MRSIRKAKPSSRLRMSPSTSTTARLLLPLVLCILSFGIGLNFHFINDSSEYSISSSFFHDDNNNEGSNSYSYADDGDEKDRKLGNQQKYEDEYKLAKDQSFGFFNDVPSHDWKIHQQIVSQYQPHLNPSDPLQYVPGHSTRNMKYWNSPQAFYQTNYEPNFSCAFEMRIGGNGNGDGPKWVCDPHRIKRLALEGGRNGDGDGCLVYSVGSNGDFQFESGLQHVLGKDTCEVHIFDFGDYEGKMPDGLNLHYHQWGLKKGSSNSSSSSNSSEDDKYYTMEDIVKKLGHEKRTIDIFKIDCDKCEWRTHQDWFGSKIPMIQQILVETHNSPKDRVLPFFDGIMGEGYVMFHKEPNIQFGNGDSIEFGFLKLHDQFFSDSKAMNKLR